MTKYSTKNDGFMQKARLAFRIIGIAGILLGFVGAGTYLYKTSGQENSAIAEAPVEQDVLQVSANATVSAAAEEELTLENSRLVQGVINPGETAGALLHEWMEPGDVQSFIEACKDVFALNKLRAGQPYTVTRDENGFCRFEYEIDANKKLVVCRLPSDFTATVEPIEYDISLHKISGKIDSSLFLTMSDVGENPVLAVRLADIFAWEINFIRDIQPGDEFTVLVEKRFREGEFKGYGKLLAAEFTNRGKKHDAYLFATSFGDQYYNADGESLKRQFLKAPLSFTRISSRFTKRRLHPIHKTWKAHPAVDYAAPTGTPVKAVANGQVTFVGRGKGEGNYIKLKHNNGYETMYLHLSKFASGLKKGNSVSQGQVIGYVGSTGYSTGPHLDFRMKKNGSYVNPETALSPRSEPLTKSSLPLFAKQRDIYRNYFTDEKAVAEYGKKSVVE